MDTINKRVMALDFIEKVNGFKKKCETEQPSEQ
jgi:hypothetical protein